MDNPSSRPPRLRLLYSTIELMKNRNIGHNGGLEMMVSPGQGGAPSRYTWPLDENEKLTGSQLSDIAIVLEDAIMKELIIRLHAQPGLFEDLTG